MGGHGICLHKPLSLRLGVPARCLEKDKHPMHTLRTWQILQFQTNIHFWRGKVTLNWNQLQHEPGITKIYILDSLNDLRCPHLNDCVAIYRFCSLVSNSGCPIPCLTLPCCSVDCSPFCLLSLYLLVFVLGSKPESNRFVL